MSKKVMVNGPGLYWYDGMTMRKLKKPVKSDYECTMSSLTIPKKFFIGKKRVEALIEAIDDFIEEYGKYQYYRGRDDVIDEILDNVE